MYGNLRASLTLAGGELGALPVLVCTGDSSTADGIAVGGNWNDLEMIKTAGLGVAMADAPDGVRARADHSCGTADAEGLRNVLTRR